MPTCHSNATSHIQTSLFIGNSIYGMSRGRNSRSRHSVKNRISTTRSSARSTIMAHHCRRSTGRNTTRLLAITDTAQTYSIRGINIIHIPWWGSQSYIYLIYSRDNDMKPEVICEGLTKERQQQFVNTQIVQNVMYVNSTQKAPTWFIRYSFYFQI